VTATPAIARDRRAAATGRSHGPERERSLHAVPEPGESGRRDGDPREAEVARRVLVVDDEPSMRMLCRINLELAGFEVSEAADGAEALAQAREQDVALILLDVMLPDIGGHEVAERLAADERTRDVPVVFLSARAAHGDLRRGYGLGAVDYITKPFDPVGLGERVQEIVGRIERGESERFRAARLAELED
jgi:DNA-binding response OmpR family regulator